MPPVCTTADGGTDGGTGTTVTVTAGAGAGSSTSQTITLDGAGTGRTFDGIGAISGGGGNSRLFLDYPEPYRSDVLDYLFKPGYGAALHILKVEIGGDMNSTDGSEASHMHTSTDFACNRGYEWWLMEQAKARNPAIKLYGLAWGAPGWIGGGNFWSQDMVDYLMKWLQCASMNGLTIDYLGGWNERGYDKSWYENLHATLAQKGFPIKVVGADSDWSIGADMAGDSTFKAAVDIVGVHYPCGGDGAPATSCPADSASLGLGVPLWASENGSQDYNTGAPAMVRAITRGYIDAKMTSFINWPVIAAIPPGLPWETMGLVFTNQPWSGAYSIGLQTWMTAHVTQFTQPGWTFIDSASGYFAGNSGNGSYVTLKSATTNDYTIVIETTTATTPQEVTFTASGGLSTGNVHIWATKMASSNTSDYFVHGADVTAAGGTFHVTLQPNYVYSISTTTGQGKSTAQSPAAAAAILPYSESFEGYPVNTLAPYFADQSGAFEVQACGGGRTGQCYRQMDPVAPIAWNSAGTAYNLIGTNDWADYTIQADVMLEHAGSVELIGRMNARDYNNISQINAYYLSVTDTGAWAIQRGTTTSGTLTPLKSGTVAALGTNSWHTIALGMTGTTLTASIDGTQVGMVVDSVYTAGPAGLSVGASSASWLNAQFDNVAITPNGPLSTAYTDVLVNRSSGQALDVTGSSTADGAIVQGAAPNGAASQKWQIAGDRSGYRVLLNANSGKALDVPMAAGAGGQVDQQSANGASNQHWQLQPTGDGYFRIFAQSGLALGVGASSSNVTLLDPNCTSNGQEWALSAAPVANATYILVNHATGWVMDVNGQSTMSGAGVIQWPVNGGGNQQWQLRAQGAGAFELANVNSGLALDVPGTPAVGTKIDQATPTGGTNQQWSLQAATTAGYYLLTSAAANLVVSSPSSTQGDQLVLNPLGGPSASQEWQLVPAP